MTIKNASSTSRQQSRLVAAYKAAAKNKAEANAARSKRALANRQAPRADTAKAARLVPHGRDVYESNKSRPAANEYWFQEPVDFKTVPQARAYIARLDKDIRAGSQIGDDDDPAARTLARAAKKRRAQLINQQMVPPRDDLTPAQTAESSAWVSEKAPKYINMARERLVPDVSAEDKGEFLSAFGLPFHREMAADPMFQAFNGVNMNRAFVDSVDALRTPGVKKFRVTAKGMGQRQVTLNVGKDGQLVAFDSKKYKKKKRGLFGTIAKGVLTVASFIPSPVQGAAIAANAVWSTASAIKNKNPLGVVAGVAGAVTGGIGAFAGKAVSAGAQTVGSAVGKVAQYVGAANAALSAVRDPSTTSLLGGIAGVAGAAAGSVASGAGGVAETMNNVATWARRGSAAAALAEQLGEKTEHEALPAAGISASNGYTSMSSEASAAGGPRDQKAIYALKGGDRELAVPAQSRSHLEATPELEAGDIRLATARPTTTPHEQPKRGGIDDTKAAGQRAEMATQVAVSMALANAGSSTTAVQGTAAVDPHLSQLGDQAPTLSSGARLDSPFVGLSRMHPKDLASTPRLQRIEWYRKELGSYDAQIRQSAQRHGVPPQLVAATVLNEMSDITLADQVQNAINVRSGSVGIAQISIDTALKNDLVDIPPGPRTDASRRAYVSKQLQIPQVAIEAAAREVAGILSKMTTHVDAAWQRSFGFTGLRPTPGTTPQAAYRSIQAPEATKLAQPQRKQRQEQLLCEMVVAAYNSPNIISSLNPGLPISLGGPAEGHYSNGRNHGVNSARIANDLALEGLFHADRGIWK